MFDLIINLVVIPFITGLTMFLIMKKAFGERIEEIEIDIQIMREFNSQDKQQLYNRIFALEELNNKK